MKKSFTAFFLLCFLNVFSQKTENTPNQKTYQKIAIRPLVYGIYGEIFLSGIGIAYEQQIGEKISIEVPIEKYFPSGIYASHEATKERGYSISPTLKIYPKGINEKAKWSIGPSIRYGVVKYTYHHGYGGRQTRLEKLDILGVELNNALTIRLNKFQLGFSSSLGMNYTQEITGTFLNALNVGFKL